MNKKQIMKRAWELAKNGAKKFGGKVREYFAAALSIAWKEVKVMEKETKTTEIRFPYCRKHWVAKIVGADPKYKLARHFLDYEEDGNDIVYPNLKDGYYQVSRFGDKGTYKKIKNGVITDVSEEEVMKHFNAPKQSILKKNRVSGTFVCWECGYVRPLHTKQSDGTCGC